MGWEKPGAEPAGSGLPAAGGGGLGAAVPREGVEGRPRELRGCRWVQPVCLFVLGMSFGWFGDRRIQEATCSLCGGTFRLKRGFKPPQAVTLLCFVVPEVLVGAVFTEESCEI